MVSGTLVQDKFITLNGLKFHYREWGNAKAPILILLHGQTAHARTWDTTAQAMQDRYRVLALDQRGHGETEWAKDYAWAARRDDISTFARTLGVQKFSLLGHSMGGRNALRYTWAYPEVVEHLVIVDAGTPIPRLAAQPSPPSVRVPPQTEFDTQEEMVKYWSADFPHIQESELLTWVSYYARQLDNGRWTMGYDPAVFNPDPSLPPLEEEWARLSKITCPTLLIRGAESRLYHREQAERMAREIPNCRFVEIPGAGHTVPLDKPSDFIKAVREFLTG